MIITWPAGAFDQSELYLSRGRLTMVWSTAVSFIPGPGWVPNGWAWPEWAWGVPEVILSGAEQHPHRVILQAVKRAATF